MTKSISAWAFAPSRTPDEIFRMAREHGFEAVELTMGERDAPVATQFLPTATRDDCLRVLEAATRADIRIASLANPLGWNYPMTSHEPQMRAQGIEMTQRGLQIASWLNVDTMLCIPGGVAASFIPNFHGTDYEMAYENALLSLQEVAPFAEEVNVTIGVENVWNMFLLSPLEFRSFLDQIGSSRVRCYFDVGNVVQTGFPEQWISILNSRIARVHFKDFKREVATLDGFCDLGEGNVNYSAVMQALHAIEYSNFVTAEFFNCEADLDKISRTMDTILESAPKAN